MNDRDEALKKQHESINHDLDVVLLTLQRFHHIRDNSGFGRIQLDVRHGRVVSSKATVRDHLSGEQKKDSTA